MSNLGVLEDTRKAPLVMMGQIEVIRGESKARAVLGSCIGLAIFDADHAIGALAHIVLPESCERDGLPGKFADTAVAEMVRLLAEERAVRQKLAAKFSGGAEMFAKLGPLKIGEENVRAVTAQLESHKIPILGCEVGGCKGRRISCTASGEMTVEVLGQEAIVL